MVSLAGYARGILFRTTMYWLILVGIPIGWLLRGIYNKVMARKCLLYHNFYIIAPVYKPSIYEGKVIADGKYQQCSHCGERRALFAESIWTDWQWINYQTTRSLPRLIDSSTKQLTEDI